MYILGYACIMDTCIKYIFTSHSADSDSDYRGNHMEQSGVVGLTIEGQAERIVSFREAPFCTQLVLAEMMGVEQITEDVVRGWVETYTLPTVKIGRRRVINLHRIRRDIERGKTVFCQGDYADE